MFFTIIIYVLLLPIRKIIRCQWSRVKTFALFIKTNISGRYIQCTFLLKISLLISIISKFNIILSITSTVTLIVTVYLPIYIYSSIKQKFIFIYVEYKLVVYIIHLNMSLKYAVHMYINNSCCAQFKIVKIRQNFQFRNFSFLFPKVLFFRQQIFLQNMCPTCIEVS